jgi:signal transduction histidine kinase
VTGVVPVVSMERPSSVATRTHDGSTSLGLAIARTIASSHEADMRVLANPDSFLNVTVNLTAAG